MTRPHGVAEGPALLTDESNDTFIRTE